MIPVNPAGHEQCVSSLCLLACTGRSGLSYKSLYPFTPWRQDPLFLQVRLHAPPPTQARVLHRLPVHSPRHRTPVPVKGVLDAPPTVGAGGILTVLVGPKDALQGDCLLAPRPGVGDVVDVRCIVLAHGPATAVLNIANSAL